MKALRSSKYLEWIRSLPCIVCTIQAGYLPSMEFHSDPHHVPEVGQGAVGMKTDDTRTIPLCRYPHHHEYHQLGRETFAEKYGLDYEYIIERLRATYGPSMD